MVRRWCALLLLCAAAPARAEVAVKVCVFFDVPLEHLGFVDRQRLRVARAATHEPLPAATVCDGWDRLLPAGTDNTPGRSLAHVAELVLAP